MNISTLAKVLGVSTTELREIGNQHKIPGFNKRNTRVNYNSAIRVTQIIRPDKVKSLKNDDRCYVEDVVTVSELSDIIGRPAGMIIKSLLMNGVMATLNEKIDYDTASLIAEELGIQIYPANDSSDESPAGTTEMIKTFDDIDDSEKNKLGTVVTRQPIVTVMGHVDHGKTTLLDTIRKTNIVAKEAGAITQHISSYQIEYNSADKKLGKNLAKGKKGVKITFVDTPGHAAFTSMRARGTQLADIIILMVSAVEGVKPQTIEVIERAKLSKTPVIVAVNKIDLPNADVEKAIQDVAAFGLVPEEWGGDTAFIPVSAKGNTNIDKLLDRILLESELREYKGYINLPGEGVVIESVLDQKEGTKTTILITKDKVKVGDAITCGLLPGKVKKITDSDNKSIQVANLGEPVTIYGVSGVPSIGDMVLVHSSVKNANEYIVEETMKLKKKKIIVQNHEQNDNVINVIIKADVTGSLEALKESLIKIPQEQTKIVIKSESIGQITESDVDYAATTQSTILAFHTSVNSTAVQSMKSNKVNMIASDVIYEILEWMEEQILKRIKHDVRIDVLGRAKILATFKSDRPSTQVFGGEVMSGKMLSSKLYRIVRDNEAVFKFEMKELQKNKSKVNEVNIMQQFGASADIKNKILVGDILECIDEIVIKKTLR